MFSSLHQWLSLSLDDPRYSHLILIPVIAAFFLYRERSSIFARTAYSPRLGAPFLAVALLLLFVHNLSTDILAAVFVFAAAFAACFGVYALKAARFPLLFLLLVVPIPFDAMDGIVSVLQRGSAEVTYALFKLAGVPMFRDGVRFELPGVGIEVAKECSSIHSGWALFITSLLLGHLFLKSLWSKISLSVLAVPIAMLTNAVRIVTIWFLAVKVDVGFLYGNLHRNGGILFSLISLGLLLAVLRGLSFLSAGPPPATIPHSSAAPRPSIS